ncbi:Monosaccharide ABC transporter substrate-binding protein, CUT2 family [Sinomonas atrocyanea]|uniref:Monosaccharide ABC transporter substrate-binding protein, CUT2 family n=1 Tax=Sinomonas atrocyanea TaxID=37927 RepID=A0A127A3F3_9MICC|nr:substrate-binding domain-containing protein [Sinomonas atrocyanea]AMM32182.1 Monosaccharide ABC transporter substrate-binding protein, CUT2 family [Sinomonas atrocyanea]GEB64782.1 sugar ABC transporter substrate-binding protein [Sinomonas atrocyanea]GGG67145.1 sugar ABC transporter substrate-binding protein [Sinomonas atrocyanea]
MIRRTAFLAAAAAITLAAAGCGSSSTSAAGGTDSAVSQKAETALKQVTGQVLSKGPNGETPSPASATTLSSDEIAKVKAMGATAAIVMHYGGNDWATAQIAGLKSEFEKLGIKVIATTDADFKPDKQVSDLETVMTQKPSIIVSIPTDPVATATAYRKAAQAGAKLVFMDNVPQGFVAGKDYVSDVSADNYGNGVVSAHEMAKALGGKGKIGVIFHQADFFVTQQRYQGFKDTIAKDYPDIQVVEEKGIAGPDFAGDAQAAANAMLSKHADLAGIWAVWDVPAEGVMAAARAAGRQDLKIATEDLGKNVAIALAKNDLVVGLGAQVPFDQGVTEAQIGAGALLGKKEPAYVALSALPVDHSNVLDAWKQVYHADAPADLQSSYKK